MQKAGTITAIVFSAVMLPALALSQNTGSGNSRDNGQTRDSREQMRFRAMDTDNDGVITRDEWQGNAQSFREHDLNHDGVLSGEEVRPRVVDDRADRSRREEMAARFERADRNGDGRLEDAHNTPARFSILVQKGRPRHERGADFSLKPGMPVQILAPLRKRTALEYFLEPLTSALWKSFTEQ